MWRLNLTDSSAKLTKAAWGVGMFRNKKKATMSAVMKEIEPYITTYFIAKPTINEDNIPIVCQILLSKYANVKLLQGVDKWIPYFKIQVKGFFSSQELTLKILEKNHKSKQQQYDLSWIDKLEEIDIALDD